MPNSDPQKLSSEELGYSVGIPRELYDEIHDMTEAMGDTRQDSQNRRRKVLKLIQSYASQKELAGRIDELERQHHGQYTDDCGYCDGTAYSSNHDVLMNRLAELKQQQSDLEKQYKEEV